MSLGSSFTSFERVEDPKRLAGAIKDAQAAVAEGKVAILDVALSG